MKKRATCVMSFPGGWSLRVGLVVSGQTIRNPKLSATDLGAAREATKEAGGAEAELVYSARIDAVTKGTFDSLVVIYSKAAGGSKDYYALVLRDGQKLSLAGEKSGRALPSGDRFLRIGLRHEDGKPPLLRVMGATGAAGQPDERQRNLDFQFTGKEFALVAQSTASVAR
jgi:hypothetical protein